MAAESALLAALAASFVGTLLWLGQRLLDLTSLVSEQRAALEDLRSCLESERRINVDRDTSLHRAWICIGHLRRHVDAIAQQIGWTDEHAHTRVLTGPIPRRPDAEG